MKTTLKIALMFVVLFVGAIFMVASSKADNDDQPSPQACTWNYTMSNGVANATYCGSINANDASGLSGSMGATTGDLRGKCATGNISIYDDYMRKDTLPGVVTNTPTGLAYTLYGPGALAPSTSVKISNHTLTSDNSETAWYAVLTNPLSPAPSTKPYQGQVNTIGATFGFATNAGGSGAEPGAGLHIPLHNDSTLINSIALHVSVQRSGFQIAYFLNGSETVLLNRTFPTALSADTDYCESVSVIGPFVNYSIAGVTGRIFDPNVVNLQLSPYAMVEGFTTVSTPPVTPYFKAFWAGSASAASTNLAALSVTAYHFDDANWLDNSRHSNNLTAVNTPTSVAGLINNAASLTAASTQYFTVADTANQATADMRLCGKDFSISTYIKLTTLPAASKYMTIMSKGASGSSNEWAMYIDGTTHKLSWAATATGGAPTTLINGTSATVNTGTWYHAVITYNVWLGQLNMYLNGTNVSTNNVVSPFCGSNTFNIGHSPWLFTSSGNSSDYFDGLIDETEIITSEPGMRGEISATDVGQLWNKGVGTAYPFGGL